MKLKALAVSLAFGAAVAAAPTFAAPAMDSVKIQEMVSASALSAEELVVELIAQYPELAAAIVEAVVKANPEAAAEVTKAAMAAAPEAAADIAEVARVAEVPNSAITEAALAAGIDPTDVAETPASGGAPEAPAAPAPSTPSFGGGNGSPVSGN
ncbi:hypothetical protein [Vibrio maerlii]|uniref:hypothetical protein n=1 Tax=Vibrio maerlii TaxID=2231648 RepID=UPI000E3D0D02|nr:hypothetical protein [Vibrio maerlii]